MKCGLRRILQVGKNIDGIFLWQFFGLCGRKGIGGPLRGGGGVCLNLVTFDLLIMNQWLYPMKNLEELIFF